VITPIHKKEDTSDVRNYRRITLLCMAYKIYAAILAKRLSEEIERKGGSLPETQAGFRKGRGTMDNVRILQQVINKEISKKRGEMYGFFIDLKAAFDKVDKKILWRAMEERDIRRGLIERVKEIYEQTKNAVRIHGNTTNWFGTRKGVRQGCLLSPLLFGLIIADVEEEMKKGQVGAMDREKQDMDIGIRRRPGTVSKERREYEGNDEKAGKIPKKQKLATERREENAVL